MVTNNKNFWSPREGRACKCYTECLRLKINWLPFLWTLPKDLTSFYLIWNRDNHCIILIFSKLFSEFLWAQSQTVLLSAEACLLFCLRPVGSAQRGNMHRPRAELYHARHVYPERTRGRRRVFRAQQHKQDQRHMSRFPQRSFTLLIPFQQPGEVTQIRSAIPDVCLLLIFATSSQSNSKFPTGRDDYFTD